MRKKSAHKVARPLIIGANNSKQSAKSTHSTTQSTTSAKSIHSTTQSATSAKSTHSAIQSATSAKSIHSATQSTTSAKSIHSATQSATPNFHQAPQNDKSVSNKINISSPEVHSRTITKIDTHTNKLSFIPQTYIKNNKICNIYDLCTIKRMIGKKIIIPAKELVLSADIRADAKHCKHILLNESFQEHHKIITIYVMTNNGIMYVINGYSYFLAINSISYKELERHPSLSNLEIKIIKVPKVSSIDVLKLIDYLK